MKTVYRAELGSLLNVAFCILLSSACAVFVLWPSTGTTLGLKVAVVAVVGFFAAVFVLFLKYEVYITDEALHAKTPLFAFLDRYETIRFDEIAEVSNVIGPFSDVQNIIFRPRDRSKKFVPITVGFGLPWRAFYDILERLPENVKIQFEPLLWKRLQRKGTPRVKALCAKWSRGISSHQQDCSGRGDGPLGR